MLVLSRKTNEQLMIGQDIKITVVEIRGGRVRLGIEAPDHVRILRSELQETIELPIRHLSAHRGKPRVLGAA